MRRYPMTGGWLLVAAMLAAGGATAEADRNAGEALFGRYCATCHGATGRGDGPTAEIISIPPGDLTALSRDNDGLFPFQRIVRRIDGREALVAHGSPMPIYGAFFEGSEIETVYHQEIAIRTSGPVLAIARYLESIQIR